MRVSPSWEPPGCWMRADCDVDFEPVAKGWLDQAVAKAGEELAPRAVTAIVTRCAPPLLSPSTARKLPFAAEMLANQRITGRGAAKDVRHVELALGDSGLTYEPGDSLGVWPRNAPELVADFVSLLKADGGTGITRDGRTLPLHAVARRRAGAHQAEQALPGAPCRALRERGAPAPARSRGRRVFPQRCSRPTRSSTCCGCGPRRGRRRSWSARCASWRLGATRSPLARSASARRRT